MRSWRLRAARWISSASWRGLERYERVGAETSDQPLAIEREALRPTPQSLLYDEAQDSPSSCVPTSSVSRSLALGRFSLRTLFFRFANLPVPNRVLDRHVLRYITVNEEKRANG